MFHRLFHTLFLSLTASAAAGQFTYRLNSSVPVETDGKTLTMPWAGGINSAQVNTIDLDSDGDEDLVIFERSANKILTFLNDQDTWRFAPEYAALFPLEAERWVLLRDFNCDGRKDIFTYNNFGISAFVNITPPGGPLKWRPYNNGEAIYTQGFTSPVNLQVNETDVIGIDDVDGDGDLDILDARFAGVGTIEFHRNMNMENTGKCDSLQFVRITQTWGNFEECNCGEYLFDGSSCAVFNGGRVLHSSGKAILTLDTDNDGDHDLLFTEENCSQIYYLENIGNAQNASMTGYTNYPAIAPVKDFPVFPAAYFEDVDFDDIPDLVVSTNTYTRTTLQIDYKNSIWYYKNTGTAALPQFSFVKKNFLQDQMIDAGDNSTPAFLDADGDGDLDLFVGSFISPGSSSRIAYYENTGTSSSPSFRHISDDFALVSRFLLYNMKIQFADLNADGKPDLVFTATSTETGITSLYFIPNSKADRLDIQNTSLVNTGFEIDPGENILVADIDVNGAQDLLVGSGVGALEYWQNTGAAGTFDFHLQDDSYLGLGVTTERQNPIAAIADLNGDGRSDLVLGDQRGSLTVYNDFRSGSSEGVKNILFDTLTQTYTEKNLGGRIWPTVANLFLESQPAIIVGNLLGGLQILKNDGGGSLPEEALLDVWPNPASFDKAFFIRADRNVIGVLYSVLGVRVCEPFTVPAHEKFTVRSPGLAAGVYILRLFTGTRTVAVRVIIP